MAEQPCSKVKARWKLQHACVYHYTRAHTDIYVYILYVQLKLDTTVAATASSGRPAKKNRCVCVLCCCSRVLSELWSAREQGRAQPVQVNKMVYMIFCCALATRSKRRERQSAPPKVGLQSSAVGIGILCFVCSLK